MQAYGFFDGFAPATFIVTGLEETELFSDGLAGP